MTEQQRDFNPDRAAMDAVSRIQDVFGTGYLDRFDAQRFAKIQDIIGDVIRAALSHAEGETVERPLGAAHNGQVFADRVEQEYGFACQAGPISGCHEWQELRKCLGVMVEYIERHPAPQVVVPENLRARCREITNWHRTGVVKQNGALAALAATLTHHDESHRMRQAEMETANEAFYLLAAAAAAPAGEAGDVHG